MCVCVCTAQKKPRVRKTRVRPPIGFEELGPEGAALSSTAHLLITDHDITAQRDIFAECHRLAAVVETVVFYHQ